MTNSQAEEYIQDFCKRVIRTLGAWILTADSQQIRCTILRRGHVAEYRFKIWVYDIIIKLDEKNLSQKQVFIINNSSLDHYLQDGSPKKIHHINLLHSCFSVNGAYAFGFTGPACFYISLVFMDEEHVLCHSLACLLFHYLKSH